MKRYAIVRVDDAEEGIKWLDILDEIVKKRKIIIDYGDTKEQLIMKVAQAIKISLRQGFTKGYKEIATDVIEFLGVEE